MAQLEKTIAAEKLRQEYEEGAKYNREHSIRPIYTNPVDALVARAAEVDRSFQRAGASVAERWFALIFMPGGPGETTLHAIAPFAGASGLPRGYSLPSVEPGRRPLVQRPSAFGGWMQSPARPPPNRFGQAGDSEHQSTIASLRQQAVEEFPEGIIHEPTSIKNAPNAKGLNRMPDIWVEDAKTGEVLKVYEAARKEKSGQFVKRERDKKRDYDALGIRSHFEEVK
ncbi:MAG TPA: hypothetical protein VJ783_20505 [Pirellulales bacterium]|nr:hypothetical protein [Pirellulales bacterium]